MTLKTPAAVVLSLLLTGCATQTPPGDSSTTTSAARTQADPRLVENLRLAENLSDDAFKSAIIGEWVSVYARPSRDYVKRLVLDSNGDALIVFRREASEQTVKGRYSVAFLSNVSPDSRMLPEITIIPSTTMTSPVRDGVVMATSGVTVKGGESLVLSRVHFGLHNGVPLSKGLLLRIDKSSNGEGVLTRAPGL